MEPRLCPAHTFEVTNDNSTGAGSLEQAIISADTTPNDADGPDQIVFKIRANATSTITAPASGFSLITEAVIIDGAPPSQDFAGQAIRLSGAGGNATANGLTIVRVPSDPSTDGSNTVIRNLSIIQFSMNGIYILGANNCRIEGNYIGTTANGTADVGNGRNGILIFNGSGNVVGQSKDPLVEQSQPRNVISGNLMSGVSIVADTFYVDSKNNRSDNNQVAGNYIGTSTDGVSRLPNSLAAVQIEGINQGVCSGNVIGGGSKEGNTLSMTKYTNVISGNSWHGVWIKGGCTANQVLGNYIGVGATGRPLKNSGDGVYIGPESPQAPTFIGSANIVRNNVISANNGAGVRIDHAGQSNQVSGNYIGTDPSGANGTIIGDPSFGNAMDGVAILTTPNTVIGSPYTPETLDADRNLISNNGGRGIILVDAVSAWIWGDYIGTKADGSGDAMVYGNKGGGILVSGISDPEISYCVISGNRQFGVRVESKADDPPTTRLYGNRIGVDANGQTGRWNENVGVVVASGHVILGAQTFTGQLDRRNTINGLIGARIDGGTVEFEGNFIGLSSDGKQAVTNSGDTPQVGIHVEGAAQSVTVGTGFNVNKNYICGHSIAGVRVTPGNVIYRERNNQFGRSISGGSIPNTVDTTVTKVANAVIELNLFANAAERAVILDACDKTLVSGNAFVSSQGDALELLNCNYVVADNNFIGTDSTLAAGLGNTGKGVSIEGNSTVTLSSNVIYYNTGQGVYDSASYQVTLTGNDIRYNVAEGVLAKAGNLSVSSGTIKYNGPAGVSIAGGVATLSGVEIAANIGHGVLVAGGVANIGSCAVSSNGGDGLLVAGGTGHTITDNSMTNNTAIDMVFAAGDTTATGAAGTAGTVRETGGNLIIDMGGADHAQLTVTGHYDLFAGDLTMHPYGTLDVSGTTGTGLLLQTGGSATVQPWGGLQVATNYELDGGNVTFYYGDIHIYGQMQVNAGHFLLGSDLTVDGGVIIGTYGTVEADYGNLHGSLVNNGMLTFGAPDQTVNGNWLTIDGSFGQTSTGVMVMGMGYAEFDRLEVFGAVGLAGTFTLLFEPGYSPNLLGGYDFIEYQSRSGTFDIVNVPGPPDPYYWVVWYSEPPDQPGWFGLVLMY
jgi:Right handed beta helix region